MSESADRGLDMWREMYIQVASEWSEVLNALELAEDATSDDVLHVIKDRHEATADRGSLADDLGETHDHELPLHDVWADVFLAQADALIARGWGRGALQAPPASADRPESVERDEAVRRAVLYVLQLSDKDVRAFMPARLISALEQDGWTAVRLPAPK